MTEVHPHYYSLVIAPLWKFYEAAKVALAELVPPPPNRGKLRLPKTLTSCGRTNQLSKLCRINVLYKALENLDAIALSLPHACCTF
jgi:hypothetical protein